MRPSRLAVSRCGSGKIPHGMRKIALAEAARMRRLHAYECKTEGITFMAYHCPFCSAWHTGTMVDYSRRDVVVVRAIQHKEQAV